MSLISNHYNFFARTMDNKFKYKNKYNTAANCKFKPIKNLPMA
jgi:hypothetical protein